MNIQEKIKDKLKDVKLVKWKRDYCKYILGEFNRVDKNITDDQALSVLNKLYKNNQEVLKHQPNYELGKNELEFLDELLPKKADEDLMRSVIEEVMNNNTFKNKMQAMKPCIDKIQEMGYDVDKGKLSEILKG